MKTAELAGAQLAKWVAKAAGICLHDAPHTKSCGNWGTDYTCTACGKDAYEGPSLLGWAPHENWNQGGPLIHQACLIVGPNSDEAQNYSAHTFWGASNDNLHFWYGNTPLIAAMRAYVASKFGDEVDETAALSAGETKGADHE